METQGRGTAPDEEHEEIDMNATATAAGIAPETAAAVRDTLAAWAAADAAASANADPDNLGATEEGQEVLEAVATARWVEHKAARAAHTAALNTALAS